MKFIKQLLLVSALLFATQAYAEPEAGKDYQIITPAHATDSGKKIEVLEFFSYACHFCYNLNPVMSAWEKKMPKDVKLTYWPVDFGHPGWTVAVRTFYSLEIMGQRERLHDELFEAWHADNPPTDEASITNVLVKQGVDREKFKDAYNSFSMQPLVNGAMRMQKSVTGGYNIQGTPTLIVDGKYLITSLQPVEMIQVLNAVIEKVRKEHKH